MKTNSPMLFNFKAIKQPVNIVWIDTLYLYANMNKISWYASHSKSHKFFSRIYLQNTLPVGQWSAAVGE